MKKLNTKILVAAHKEYKMPKDKELYLPVFVGSALHPDTDLKFQSDAEGDNISLKNSNYNELTAIYWAWKNLNADAVGLVHYRRYLSLNTKKSLDDILNRKQVEELLSKNDIILPKKRNYYIETNGSHYFHIHEKEPMNVMRQVISERYPEYSNALETVLKRTSAHMFNMFIMKKDIFDNYCGWMFDILFEVEKRIDITGYSTYEKRVYGFLSELMLDTWLEVNRYKTVEVNFVFMEKQNWLKKGGSFLSRKLKGHV